MSDTFGALAPQQQTPADPSQVADLLSKIPRWLLPNIVSLAKGEPAPPMANMPAEPGKVSSTDDPRIAGAVGEGANAAMNLAPLAMPIGGAASLATRGAEALGPRLGMMAREAVGYRPPGAVIPGLAATLASDPAEAGPKLTRQQQRELEMAKQKHQMEAETAANLSRQQAETSTAAARQQSLDAAEAERIKAENASRIAIEQQRSADTASRENEAALANRPFREKFPSLANAMSNSGMALAALLPYGTRAWQSGRQTGFIKSWESTVAKAEDALTKGDMPQARLLVNQLDGFRKQATMLDKASAKGGSNAALYGASAALPLETSMAPEQIDLASGSPEAKSRAIESLTDPVRVPAGLAQGATFAALGAKAPLIGGNRVAPEAASAGAVKTFQQMLKDVNKKTAAPRKRASSVVPFSIAPGE